jgi:hypothetical protein
MIGDVTDEGEGWWRATAHAEVGPVVAALQPLAADGTATILDVKPADSGLEAHVQRMLGRG